MPAPSIESAQRDPITLAAGTRLGPYEILSPLGAGGMGEVYRANDTRLDRAVAVKVLPTHMASSPEIRQRFEREAKTISQLSHPHICALYDVGREGETDYLVMELLEGETLSDRLAKGPLALEQTLRYGTEIAEALDKAHRQGIVHRDLKPGNVMLTRSGVKLLDFGLARLRAKPSIPELSVSEMATEARPLTAEGTILGTLQYMAPEQLEGKEADARADVFAFGAVLYEMTTGRRAFSGGSAASVISAILTSEPPALRALAPLAPRTFERAVAKSLQKDPDERWQSAGDLASELAWIAQSGLADADSSATRRRGLREIWGWITAFLIAAVAGWLLVGRPQGRKPEPIRFLLAPPEGKTFVEDATDLPFALSADGRRLAFVASSQGKRLLWIQSFDRVDPQTVPGTDGAISPFWSPDGRAIGFFADGKLKKVLLEGGTVETLCGARGGSGSWSRDGIIIFSEWGAGNSKSRFIQKVSASGGRPEAATASEQEWHFWPEFLPDGRHFLYLKSFEPEKTALYVGSLDSKAEQLLFPIKSRVQFGAGYLFFVRDGVLFARRFDLRKLELSGEPLAVAEQVVNLRPTGAAGFAVSAGGAVIAYQSARLSRLNWVDRNGRVDGTLGAPAYYDTFRISPDGKHVAIDLSDPRTGSNGLWIHDVARGVRSRFTVNPWGDDCPIWSPDGNRLAYSAGSVFAPNLSLKVLGESEPIRLLTKVDEVQWPTDWSADGRYLIYSFNGGTQGDVAAVAITGDHKAFPLLSSEFNEGEATLSPDGRWLAFVSDESGTPEVYVGPFLEKGQRTRISATGGSEPRWRRDGKELFYLSGDHELMAVPVVPSPEFRPGQPARLFPISSAAIEGSIGVSLTHYDVTSDGTRFLVQMSEGAAGPSPVSVILNWSPAEKTR